MSSLNRVTLIGNLGQDPELRYTQDQKAVATLSVATSENFKDSHGKFVEKTEWHRVVVWGNQAESCGKYLTKGKKVAIEGKLQTRKWQDKAGQDRYVTEIVATQVLFLSPLEPARPQASPGGFDEFSPSSIPF